MEINSIACVCFSPTGTTKKIVEQIAEGMQMNELHMIDCTIRKDRKTDAAISGSDLVILAVPVYYGRVPEEIVPYLNSLDGNGTPVVPVVVYGNRAYDDALLELYDIAASKGFIPVAGGAFIAEHSYSTSSRPIARSRPDTADIRKAREFGAAVAAGIKKADMPEAMEKSRIPGNHPYIEPKNLNMLKQVRHTLAITPETDMDLCTQCGTCTDMCPTGAIDPDDVSVTDRWNCLICFTCVKNCPENARQMTEPNFQKAIEQLQKNCLDRKEPETFM